MHWTIVATLIDLGMDTNTIDLIVAFTAPQPYALVAFENDSFVLGVNGLVRSDCIRNGGRLGRLVRAKTEREDERFSLLSRLRSDPCWDPRVLDVIGRAEEGAWVVTETDRCNLGPTATVLRRSTGKLEFVVGGCNRRFHVESGPRTLGERETAAWHLDDFIVYPDTTALCMLAGTLFILQDDGDMTSWDLAASCMRSFARPPWRVSFPCLLLPTNETIWVVSEENQLEFRPSSGTWRRLSSSRCLGAPLLACWL